MSQLWASEKLVGNCILMAVKARVSSWEKSLGNQMGLLSAEEVGRQHVLSCSHAVSAFP